MVAWYKITMPALLEIYIKSLFPKICKDLHIFVARNYLRLMAIVWWSIINVQRYLVLSGNQRCLWKTKETAVNSD